MSEQGDWFEVGQVVLPHGVRGQVKVRTYNDDSSQSVLVHTPTWTLRWEHGRVLEVKASNIRPQGRQLLIASLAGVEDRDAAQSLVGAQIVVARASFPELQADEHYWSDLVGLSVYGAGGYCFGVVTELSDNGAHAILHVAPPALQQRPRSSVLIPFVREHILCVDKDGIQVDWPEEF